MKVVGSLEESPKRERSAVVSSFGARSHKSLVHHWIRCCQQGKVRRQVLVLFWVFGAGYSLLSLEGCNFFGCVRRKVKAKPRCSVLYFCQVELWVQFRQRLCFPSASARTYFRLSFYAGLCLCFQAPLRATFRDGRREPTNFFVSSFPTAHTHTLVRVRKMCTQVSRTHR